jgi:hypothetical protein
MQLLALLALLAAPGWAEQLEDGEPGASTCPLDGVGTDGSHAARNPLAVMVENHPAARPQSGLDKACLVYETVVEGGITRFMAVFVHGDAEVVGPVRSTRQVFASLAKAWDAFLAHCWAKPSGYDTIKRLRVRNMDVVGKNRRKIKRWREKSRKRPHNLYLSTSQLRRAADKAYARKGGNRPLAPVFEFRDDTPREERPSGGKLRLRYSTRKYNPTFTYDPESNDYTRRLGRRPHRMTDHPKRAKGELELRPRNILVLTTRFRRMKGAKNPRVLNIRTVGSGKASVFSEGRRTDGRWIRAREGDSWRIVDNAGEPIPLVRGQVWVSIVNGKRRIKWEPAE